MSVMSVSNKLRCNLAWNRNPAHSVLSILSRERVKDFSKKYSSLIEASQNFQNLRQKSWLLWSNRTLSEFVYGI